MKNSNLAELLIENQHLKVINPGTAVNESDINSLEKKLGMQLPSQLRSFYLHWNGGLPCPVEMPLNKSVWIRLIWNQGADAAQVGPATSLSALFQINGQASVDFLGMWNNYKESIPQDVLCFAPDPGSSLFLIGTKHYNLGKIFFWESSYQANIGEGEIPNYDNIAFVANSFSEFILLLREEPNRGENLDDWVKRVYVK